MSYLVHMYMYISVYYSNSSVVANKHEPQHDKSNKMMCAQRRLRSAWTSAQSDQSSLHEETLDP